MNSFILFFTLFTLVFLFNVLFLLSVPSFNINDVYRMNPDGRISKSDGIINYGIGIRPVVNLKKSALE